MFLDITERFGPLTITPRVVRTYQSVPATRPLDDLKWRATSDLVDTIRDMLLEAGWTLEGAVQPECRVFVYRIGVADPDAEHTGQPVGCEYPYFFLGMDPADVTLAASGTRLVGFDPYRHSPAVSCESFAYGLTHESSEENLMEKIRTTTPFRWEATGNWPWNYRLIAKDESPGTAMNGYIFGGDIFGTKTVGGIAFGGGWVLQSPSYRGHHWTLTARALPMDNLALYIFNRVELVLQHSAGGASAQSLLDTSKGYLYRLIATPYQFTVWAADVAGDTFGSNWSSAFLCSMPWVPERLHEEVGACAVAVTAFMPEYNLPASSLRRSLVPTPTYVALNGPLVRRDGGAGFLAHRYHGGYYPVLTALERPLLANPYVWMRPGPGADPLVVGRLWDGLIASDAVAYGSRTLARGESYELLSRQTADYGNSAGSLWLADQSAEEEE